MFHGMSLERGIGLLGWLPGSHDYARLLQAWKSVPLSLSVHIRRRLHRPRWPTFLLRFYGSETLSCVYRKLDSTVAMVKSALCVPRTPSLLIRDRIASRQRGMIALLV
jgi:hypothetical protein